MQEISLNILDIVQNSVKAGATLIRVTVDENVRDNFLTVTVADNGCGMTGDQLEAVTNPFFTTRTTRKVGLGVPLFKMAAEMAGGGLTVRSEVGAGTEIEAKFTYDHVDRMPLGDIVETMVSVIQCNEDIDFIYTHLYNGRRFVMDTREIRRILADVPLDTEDVVFFLKDFLGENIDEIRKVNENEKFS